MGAGLSVAADLAAGKMSGEPHGTSPEKENRELALCVVTAEARAEVAEAKAKAEVAEAKAKAEVAEAKAKAELAEAKAKAELAEAKAKAEIAEARAQVLQSKLDHQADNAAHKLELLHRDHARENMELLTLKKMLNLRGAVEFVSGRIATGLQLQQITVPRGVQPLLDAALVHDAELKSALTLLARRHTQREQDVRACFSKLYHTLSKTMHGVGDAIVVRTADFPAPAERLALCALLERYDVAYKYVDSEGDTSSPYALSGAERLTLGSAASQ